MDAIWLWPAGLGAVDTASTPSLQCTYCDPSNGGLSTFMVCPNDSTIDCNSGDAGTTPLVQNLYQGMLQDAVTGFYYERARWYSPSLGTWISQDPLSYVNGANTYQFVMGNPVGATDPSGLWHWYEPWAWFQLAAPPCPALAAWQRGLARAEDDAYNAEVAQQMAQNSSYWGAVDAALGANPQYVLEQEIDAEALAMEMARTKYISRHPKPRCPCNNGLSPEQNLYNSQNSGYPPPNNDGGFFPW